MTAINISRNNIHKLNQGTSPSETSINQEIKVAAWVTADTVDDAEDIICRIGDVGITSAYDVWAFTHSTTDDIIITESTEVTTKLQSAGILSARIQGSTDDKKRVIIVWGE